MSVAFLILGLLTVAGAGGVLFLRDVVHSAFSLLLTFLGVAGLFFLLRADFLGTVQILIYAGGIMILFLFAIMLTKERHDNIWQRSPTYLVAAGLGSLSLLVLLLIGVGTVPWPGGTPGISVGSTRAIGLALFTRYVLAFEAISLVLLVAMIGAIAVARNILPSRSRGLKPRPSEAGSRAEVGPQVEVRK